MPQESSSYVELRVPGLAPEIEQIIDLSELAGEQDSRRGQVLILFEIRAEALIFFYLVCVCDGVLKTEPRVLFILGKCSITDLHP